MAAKFDASAVCDLAFSLSYCSSISSLYHNESGIINDDVGIVSLRCTWYALRGLARLQETALLLLQSVPDSFYT